MSSSESAPSPAPAPSTSSSSSRNSALHHRRHNGTGTRKDTQSQEARFDAESTRPTQHAELGQAPDSDPKQAPDTDPKQAPDSETAFPRVIPPTHASRARTLVLCFDGTGNQFDADNTNIVNFCTLLKKDDRKEQVLYYQTGIGTTTPSKSRFRVLSGLSKALDTMVAWSLDEHVMDGYEFLMQNYHVGDSICIFGFSRGAYTARSLAGMLHKVGLLPPGNWQQVPYAYAMYASTDALGWEQSTSFKNAFCMDVPIKFMGVWETVDSVGAFISRSLPFTTSNTIISTFRQALALDEHRARFKSNLWHRTPSASDAVHQFSVRQTRESASTSTGKWDQEFDEHEVLLNAMDMAPSVPKEQLTDVEEVWFSGCHTDVGGGSVKNGVKHTLARISLRWMVRECFKANTGILFDSAKLRLIGMDPASLYPFVAERAPAMSATGMQIRTTQEVPQAPLYSRILDVIFRRTRSTSFEKAPPRDPVYPSGGHLEEEEELADALSPIYDQLKMQWIWWILEIVPMGFKHQQGDDKWVTWFGPNLARPRQIPERKEKVKVHRSVRMRMEATGPEQYHPKATLPVDDDVIWVD